MLGRQVQWRDEAPDVGACVRDRRARALHHRARESSLAPCCGKDRSGVRWSASKFSGARACRLRADAISLQIGTSCRRRQRLGRLMEPAVFLAALLILLGIPAITVLKIARMR